MVDWTQTHYSWRQHDARIYAEQAEAALKAVELLGEGTVTREEVIGLIWDELAGWPIDVHSTTVSSSDAYKMAVTVYENVFLKLLGRYVGES